MSFLSKFKNEFQRLFHDLPKWETTASEVVNFGAPLIEGLLAIEDPALLPVITPIVNKVKVDLTTASVLINDGVANPTLTGALTDIQTNLASILSLDQVKNSAVAAKITATVNLLVTEFQSVAAELPAATATAKE